MIKGEVWRVRLPLGGGHVQAGERPAVVLQDDAVGAKLPTVLIVPFTSSLGASRFPGTVLIQPDNQNGLTMPSVALVFQLSAVDKRNCIKRLGMLDDLALDQIFAMLDRLTDR
jgi:mRNA interferase MazF